MNHWKSRLLELTELITFVLFLLAFVSWTTAKLWGFVGDLLAK